MEFAPLGFPLAKGPAAPFVFAVSFGREGLSQAYSVIMFRKHVTVWSHRLGMERVLAPECITL